VFEHPNSACLSANPVGSPSVGLCGKSVGNKGGRDVKGKE